MKVIIDNVISINGMIARENGGEDWLPNEGYDDMIKAVEEFDNLVFGRETYEYITRNESASYFSLVKTKNKILVTSQKDYIVPEGDIAVAHSPNEVISILKSRGLKTLYLIGGGELNASFLQEGLVNEVRLTVHPYIITKGRPLFGSRVEWESNLELKSITRLSLGRINAVYKVKNDR